MPFLRSLPGSASLFDVFEAHPHVSRPLLHLHEVLLRGESPLTVPQRELLAAYVSGLNVCGTCHGLHRRVAAAFGVDEGLLEELVDDVDASAVAEEMKPLLRLARKLTLTPSRMTRADAEAVFAVGWDDRALHDAVSVCALLNYVNRLAQGLGLETGDEELPHDARVLHERGYAALLGDELVGNSGGDEESPADDR